LHPGVGSCAWAVPERIQLPTSIAARVKRIRRPSAKSRIDSTRGCLIRADVAVADGALVPRQAGLVLWLAMTALAWRLRQGPAGDQDYQRCGQLHDEIS
jgi:hypothetical protein